MKQRRWAKECNGPNLTYGFGTLRGTDLAWQKALLDVVWNVPRDLASRSLRWADHHLAEGKLDVVRNVPGVPSILMLASTSYRYLSFLWPYFLTLGRLEASGGL